MLDNLREDAEMGYEEEDELLDFLDEVEEEEETDVDPFAFLSPITNMTPVQRFIIAALIFLMVCLIGSMVLLVTGKLAIL